MFEDIGLSSNSNSPQLYTRVYAAGSFQSGASDYASSGRSGDGGGGGNDWWDTGKDFMRTTGDKQLTNAAGDSLSGEMTVYGLHNTGIRKTCMSLMSSNNGGSSNDAWAGRWWSVCTWKQTTDVTGIQFYFSNGASFTKGKIYIYGRSR
jgi:hypothetical protein